MAKMTSEAAAPVLDQLMTCRELVVRIAKRNKLSHVAVFGSVARGTETAVSDVDLLVDPREDASLFDLAQFSIDMEKLLGRRVDVVIRRPEASALSRRRN
jgi:uncharacterized protein